MGGLLPGKENLLTPQLSNPFVVDVFDELREDCICPWLWPHSGGLCAINNAKVDK
jgi:hypothetical protein